MTVTYDFHTTLISNNSADNNGILVVSITKMDRAIISAICTDMEEMNLYGTLPFVIISHNTSAAVYCGSIKGSIIIRYRQWLSVILR